MMITDRGMSFTYKIFRIVDDNFTALRKRFFAPKVAPGERDFVSEIAPCFNNNRHFECYDIDVLHIKLDDLTKLLDAATPSREFKREFARYYKPTFEHFAVYPGEWWISPGVKTTSTDYLVGFAKLYHAFNDKFPGMFRITVNKRFFTEVMRHFCMMEWWHRVSSEDRLLLVRYMLKELTNWN